MFVPIHWLFPVLLCVSDRLLWLSFIKWDSQTAQKAREMRKVLNVNILWGRYNGQSSLVFYALWLDEGTCLNIIIAKKEKKIKSLLTIKLGGEKGLVNDQLWVLMKFSFVSINISLIHHGSDVNILLNPRAGKEVAWRNINIAVPNWLKSVYSWGTSLRWSHEDVLNLPWSAFLS